MTNELESTPQSSASADREQTCDPSNNDSQEDISLGDPNDIASLSSLKAIRSESEDTNRNEQADHNDEVEEDPLLTRYHTACQKGDLATVKEMIHGRLLEVNKDGDTVEHITGLHWASINNRLSVVDFLISQGADVNSRAGALHATPLHWAARYGYVYIVDFLLKHGADPTLTDDQGFNLLHLSVNSSNIMLVLYVLFNVVSKGFLNVDCQDPKGRTSLLWAAYQGDSLTVAALLKFGANIKITDTEGFTPLHWGTVKGQPHVLKYLIQDGADFFQKTDTGKDCFAIAQEMNTVYSLREALIHSGFDSHGYPIKKRFKKSQHARLVTFITPFLFLGLAFALFSHVNPLFAIIVIFLMTFATKKGLNKFVLPSYGRMGIHNVTLLRSPLLSGVFFGTLLWVTIVWFFKVMPWTFADEPYANILMLMILLFEFYLFGRLVNSDPGCLPEETDHENVRQTISDLLEIGKFDTKNFCIETWTRKPLRSKFSSLNNAVVARFDHYCPWIFNDVGLKNHKAFIFFIALMESGIFTFFALCLEYFDELEDAYEDEYQKQGKCFILGDSDLCSGLKYDKFVFLILSWAMLQSIWVASLIFVQAFQICKGMTNSEFNVLMKENKAAGANVLPFNENFNTTPEGFAPSIELDEDNNDTVLAPVPGSTLRKPRTCFGVCYAVTGMDQWFAVIKETIGIKDGSGHNVYSITSKIPTNYGWKRNLKDFWLTSDVNAPLWRRILYSPTGSKALLNGIEVDYFKLYKFTNKDVEQVSDMV
ncbi:palmitoyltransferase AKR1 SKDI_04G4780 [Saccharomyces kudriavzevii IFO 1802]|uniref:Uncharacterized protein n=2 Tax=Saccharomyces kudriavzevii (strain ATCC MYA-4449 / AS 2.2408 / CBS 8840 / NBRC 1802 / NCYC 2889) TaxID=226230 RepID=A0AA35JGG7_SACK1|nr:uncharacterized protein SKDI_04G4780 [Saccharomyces kudriavzevii IFO 1802]EJT44157.1 AKR1-like protein [Saccharomyces kudriavzevii IFO 1802]CAI4058708.1 hypothetical protein SKDI_04G4780 [Saccharomyces kudriavzevii IFO 1802]